LAALSLVTLVTVLRAQPAEATPALQFPWPTGTLHRINAGNCTYDCAPKHLSTSTNRYALDFEFGIGETVTAVTDGQVVDGKNNWTTESTDDRGNFLEIDYGAGYRIRYLHLQLGTPWAPGIAVGVWVKQGQHIGYSGNTAFVAAHLHFDLKRYDALGSPSAHLPEPMSGQVGFGAYGAVPGVSSPSWVSRPVRWPTGNFYTANARADALHLCCDTFLKTWQSNGNGTFGIGSFSPQGGNYNMNLGTWLSGNYDLGSSRDLAHLCCSNYMHTWLGNGAGSFSVPIFTPSGGGYNVQNGSWQSGRFLSGLDSLFHICCSTYGHLWLSNGNGTWVVGAPYSPWPGYGMQLGSWLTGDFDGNGLTDLFHAWGATQVNVWLSTGSGTFNVIGFTPRGGGYSVQNGSYRVADINDDGRSDIVHLCCANYIETWLSNGNGTFNLPGAFQPWAGYGVQQGHWLTGEFTQPGGLGADLIHICCATWANIWKSNGNGTFSVVNAPNGWSPWANYGMLEGSWHVGDFTGDGRTDLLHALGGSSANIWKAKSNNSGTFDVNGFTPGAGYCMLC